MAIGTPSRMSAGVAAKVVVRPLTAANVACVTRMLAGLPTDYPGGDRWLAKRLGDVLEGDATCELATLDARVVGVAIGTPKVQATKLSTIFVDPSARRARIGTQLLDSFIRRAPSGGEIYVTVAHHKWHELKGLLESRSFTATAIELDRYGRGRHEIVAARVDS